MKYLNVYENGRPEQMAHECQEEEVTCWIKRFSNVSQDTPLSLCTKEVTVHKTKAEAVKEYQERLKYV